MTGKIPMTEEVAVERAATTGRAVEASLEEFLTFERLLADLSARLANVSVAEVETEIDSALRELQEFLGFDRSNLFEFTADGWATIVCSVSRDAVEPPPARPRAGFPQMVTLASPHRAIIKLKQLRKCIERSGDEPVNCAAESWRKQKED
jgi:hypothetical protein